VKKPIALFSVLTIILLTSASVGALERLEPAAGCYIGFSLEPGHTIFDLSSRLGITPAVYNRYFKFPESDSDLNPMIEFLEEVASFNAMAMVTLEPWEGLEKIVESNCVRVAELCASFERAGITGIFIRFAHEMNGNWYPWSQQPILYKEKFRLLALHVRSRTARTAMLWAPNFGLGYPFGTPRPAVDSPEFKALDINKDGTINHDDDCYEPYYPGDDAVDWVGLTLYHWGNPFLENEPPAPNTFVRSITGIFQGNIPNFYLRYCAGAVRRKPMAIPETGAFFNTERSGSSELAIKQAWWRQVFNSGGAQESMDVASYYSKIKCVGWFDVLKQEGTAGNNWIDWRVSADPSIRAAFVHYLRAPRTGGRPPHHLTADEARCLLLTTDCETENPLSVEFDSDGPHLTLPTSLGRTYQLLTSPDLKCWTLTDAFIIGTGGPIRIPVSDPSPATFYRVQAIPYR